MGLIFIYDFVKIFFLKFLTFLRENLTNSRNHAPYTGAADLSYITLQPPTINKTC